jgi:rhamnosyltransferase
MIMRKFAIGFVIYNPSVNLIQRINLALASGFSLYIFDNSPQDGFIREFIKSKVKCKYITCGKNVGLGYGISSVCAQAYYDSFHALLFFDQDTIFNISTLLFIEEFYVKYHNLKSSYSSIVFNGKNVNDLSVNRKYILKDVLLSISSGSLFFLDNANKLNWHNHKYFVDCVDYEFCFKSNINKFKIGECSMTPGFDHVSEQADVKYKIFGKERMLRKYSLKRIYDTTVGSTRLFFASIIKRNVRYSVAIIRSLVLYLNWQLVVRLIDILKLKRSLSR